MLKRKINQLLAALILALASGGAYAAAPYGVKDCGFDTTKAISNGVTRYVAGQLLDCILWGCIPIIGPAASLTAPLEEIDSDCAGAVFEIRTSQGYRYTWSWDRDSLSGARRDGLRYCRSERQGGCTEVMVVRHAAAGYQPKSGGRGHWAQGSDKPTAINIAKARCESAGRGPCTLIGVFENSG